MDMDMDMDTRDDMDIDTDMDHEEAVDGEEVDTVMDHEEAVDIGGSSWDGLSVEVVNMDRDLKEVYEGRSNKFSVKFSTTCHRDYVFVL